jgi:hypothetical protein
MAGDFTCGSTFYTISSLTQNTKLYGGNENAWGWAENLDGNGADHKPPIYVFKANETYTLTISGRSQRFNIDRIVLRLSSVTPAFAKDPNRPQSTTTTAGTVGVPTEPGTGGSTPPPGGNNDTQGAPQPDSTSGKCGAGSLSTFMGLMLFLSLSLGLRPRKD